MALQFVKNYFNSIISYFRIDVTDEGQPPSASLLAESVNISREGSSVDPDPASTALYSDTTTSEVKYWSEDDRGTFTHKKLSIEDGIEFRRDERSLTAATCTCSTSQSLSAEATSNISSKDCKMEGDKERHLSAGARSGSSQPRNDVCKKASVVQKCSAMPKWVPPIDDCDDNSGVCALYRLCPQLAPGAVFNVSTQPRTQVKGRVAFNSPLFSEGDFELRITHEKVCLEFIQIDAEEIHGYIRVLNNTFEKDVKVYYTKNQWKVVRTTQAHWVESVCSGRMDRFAFTIPGRQSVGDLTFSLTFNEIRDDNKGHNYTVTYKHY